MVHWCIRIIKRREEDNKEVIGKRLRHKISPYLSSYFRP